jgi:Uma2 family endonuclease
MPRHILPLKESRPISGDELLAMREIGRCELVEGRIVRMAPTKRRHGRCESRFGMALGSFVYPRKLGEVLVGEVGIYTGRNPDTVRGADALFISTERYARCRSDDGFLDVAPELVVEVLSPDDPAREVRRKLKEYFAAGVKLIWVADPRKRTVRAYRSLKNVRVFTARDTLTGGDILPGFSVPVASLFD